MDEYSLRGIETERIDGVPQDRKLNNVIETTERKLAGGALKDSGSRLMPFAVGNSKTEARGNAIAITKQGGGIGHDRPADGAVRCCHCDGAKSGRDDFDL